MAIALALSACAPGGPPVPVAQTPTPSPSQTEPAEPDLRFAVIGDFGTGSPVQHQLARRMCRWRNKRPFDLVVTTGDNVYPDGHPARFHSAFHEPYACLLSDGVSFHASLGNHDYLTRRGRPEINEPAFGMPKRNYVLRTGGVRFVVADSNRIDREWLARATRARSLDRWTVVAFHHPVFSPGTQRGSTPGYRPGLPRLFRRRGVDLVLNGHDHLYAVTRPLRKIRYVVTGGGGAGLYPCGDAWFSARCLSRHHFLYVRATGTELRVKAVGINRVLHRFATMGRD